MMSYRDTYEAWLASPALSEAEKTELEAIKGDDKEIDRKSTRLNSSHR